MTRRPLSARLSADAIVALATLLPLAVFLVAERRIAGAAGFPLDDSWIHLHFARNLVEGAGFSYNAGTPVGAKCGPRSSPRWRRSRGRRRSSSFRS